MAKRKDERYQKGNQRCRKSTSDNTWPNERTKDTKRAIRDAVNQRKTTRGQTKGRTQYITVYIKFKKMTVSCFSSYFCLFLYVIRYADDVDLYAGAISETPRGGSTLGPTFTCLFAKQLYAFRRGDRLWYERQNGSNGFTSGKFENRHRCRIIC